MYSNPKPLFKATAEKRIREVLDKCAKKKREKTATPKSADDGTSSSSSSTVIDLTIQVRTFIDTVGYARLEDYFNKSHAVDTFRHCALRSVVSAQNRKSTGKNHPSTDAATNLNQESEHTPRLHHRAGISSTTSLCVYVTSDSPQAADDIRAYLEADPNFNGNFTFS